jgi:hypothetical protein
MAALGDTPGDSQGSFMAHAVIPELPGDAILQSGGEGMLCK